MIPWQAVFFDFDGVILDSVPIKTRAFAEIYRPYGKQVEEAVVAYHLVHGGISRFEKFRYYHRELLGQTLSEEELQGLGQSFEERVLKGVLEAAYIPGACSSLEALKNAGIPTFVVSGTPEGEVRNIVEARGLGPFFAEVHGSPRKKEKILADILDRWIFESDRTLFLGDAMTDYLAATSLGIPFLGIVAEGEVSPFPEGTATSAQVRLVRNGADYKRPITSSS